ncbi:uncharacterized protein G2W53_014386 [Senna tora]|uniref:Uncharacterized protein n=1 Tax=Senna tora TaxID=362788 RepID=A0A834WTE7_9FABA|nr:uncharacterized protein G2W53_014386 [Senna tora]
MSVRVVFANRSGFDAPIGVVLAWEERGSCLNIFRTTNCDRISETFTNYEAQDLLRNESNTLVRVVFANWSGFDAPIGVILGREERGSCLNIFQTINRGRISENFMNYEAKDLLPKSVDHVFTYSGLEITVGSQKLSRITRQKTCCASESKTSVRVVFANRNGFDAPIGVVLAWEERGSCLNTFRTTNHVDMAWEERGSCINIFRMTNHGRILETFTNYEAKDSLRNRIGMGGAWIMSQHIPDDKSRSDLRKLHELRGKRLVAQERGSCLNMFRMTNRGRISETLTNYEAKDLLRRSVDHVLTYSGREIAVESQKSSLTTRQKTCCGCESKTSLVRGVFANGSGFDAPNAVVLALEECRSCLNIFRMTNRGRISETFTNYAAKDLLRKNLHELQGKRLVAQVSQTRRFALYLRTGVVLMLQLESSWHGRIVENVLTNSGRQIAVESQKSSRIMRQKACCASESNTSDCVVFANHGGFDAPIGVVLAWQERGSCLNMFRMTNRGRISETLTNYEAKDLLRRSVDHVLTYSGRQVAVGSQKSSRITGQKTCCGSESTSSSVHVVFANRSGFDAPIGVVLAWEECRSCIIIFRMKNRGRISETFTNYEAKELLRKSVDHVLTYSERKIAIGSQKTSRITRQKTCCVSESKTSSVRVVFANPSGFDAPIGVVLAYEER